MEEIQLVFWRMTAPVLPTQQQMHFAKPVWMHSDEFIRAHGTGWRAVGYQLIGAEAASGDLVMSVMLAREIATDLELPEVAEGAGL